MKFFVDPLIWVKLWDHTHPHGGPQHQQGQGLILEHTSKTKSNKLLNFSLKKLNKEDLIENIDRLIPIGIVILTLFIAFVV